MKAQFDFKTERTWPNFEPSARATNTRECVLRQFWQTFIKKTGSASETPYACATKLRVLLCYGSDGQN